MTPHSRENTNQAEDALPSASRLPKNCFGKIAPYAHGAQCVKPPVLLCILCLCCLFSKSYEEHGVTLSERGSVLVFLPGLFEIKYMQEALSKLVHKR